MEKLSKKSRHLKQKRRRVKLETSFHVPVLVNSVIDFLAVKAGEKYLDATIGGGGHTEKILAEGGLVLGIDYDQDAIVFCQKKFAKEIAAGQLVLYQGNFANLSDVTAHFGFEKVKGTVFDLGVSAHQLKDAARGFSFSIDAPLDMRVDQSLKITAADFINNLPERRLNELFKNTGGEKLAGPIAKAVVGVRAMRSIERTSQLVAIIEKVVKRRGKLHPATKVFMALRIAVNSELENLKQALPAVVGILDTGGRLVVISFQSAEDAIVKNFFRLQPQLSILTKKPIRPTREEILLNSASQAAKLRAAVKI